jgi:hypothetical protein
VVQLESVLKGHGSTACGKTPICAVPGRARVPLVPPSHSKYVRALAPEVRLSPAQRLFPQPLQPCRKHRVFIAALQFAETQALYRGIAAEILSEAKDLVFKMPLQGLGAEKMGSQKPFATENHSGDSPQEDYRSPSEWR